MPARARAGVGQAPQYQRWTSRSTVDGTETI
jgi:hypothetical protein